LALIFDIAHLAPIAAVISAALKDTPFRSYCFATNRIHTVYRAGPGCAQN
jgi:hypothetical protein